MGLGQSVWIGACQVLAAAFPGTSRSMATIAAGQVAIYCIALGLLMLPLASRLAR